MTHQRVHITVPPDVKKAVEKKVGRGSVSKFYADAAREKLERDKFNMKYIISRTSISSGCPCDIAKKVSATYLDRRVCRTLQEAREHPALGEDWFNEGRNHRVEAGTVVRDLDQEDVWIAEIPDLLEFMEKVGHELILQESTYKEYPIEVEIYDAYR